MVQLEQWGTDYYWGLKLAIVYLIQQKFKEHHFMPVSLCAKIVGAQT